MLAGWLAFWRTGNTGGGRRVQRHDPGRHWQPPAAPRRRRWAGWWVRTAATITSYVFSGTTTWPAPSVSGQRYPPALTARMFGGTGRQYSGFGLGTMARRLCQRPRSPPSTPARWRRRRCSAPGAGSAQDVGGLVGYNDTGSTSLRRHGLGGGDGVERGRRRGRVQCRGRAARMSAGWWGITIARAGGQHNLGGRQQANGNGQRRQRGFQMSAGMWATMQGTITGAQRQA